MATNRKTLTEADFLGMVPASLRNLVVVKAKYLNYVIAHIIQIIFAVNQDEVRPLEGLRTRQLIRTLLRQFGRGTSSRDKDQRKNPEKILHGGNG